MSEAWILELVFHPISKHLEFRQNNPLRVVSVQLSTRCLEIGWKTVSRVQYIRYFLMFSFHLSTTALLYKYYLCLPFFFFIFLGICQSNNWIKKGCRKDKAREMVLLFSDRNPNSAVKINWTHWQPYLVRLSIFISTSKIVLRFQFPFMQ